MQRSPASGIEDEQIIPQFVHPGDAPSVLSSSIIATACITMPQLHSIPSSLGQASRLSMPNNALMAPFRLQRTVVYRTSSWNTLARLFLDGYRCAYAYQDSDSWGHCPPEPSSNARSTLATNIRIISFISRSAAAVSPS